MAGLSSIAGVLRSGDLPVFPLAARSAVGGSIVAFVACLLAAELLLGIAQPGHTARVALLSGLLISTVAMAGMLHP